MLRRQATFRKGLLTIPVDIRRALGLKAGDELILTLDDSTVRLSKKPLQRETSTRARRVKHSRYGK